MITKIEAALIDRLQENRFNQLSCFDLFFELRQIGQTIKKNNRKNEVLVN